MEQNFNQAPVSTEASAGSISRKIIMTVTILLFVLVIILAGIGWYVRRDASDGLTVEQINNMKKPISIIPLTKEERANMTKPATDATPLTAEEQANMLKN